MCVCVYILRLIYFNFHCNDVIKKQINPVKKKMHFITFPSIVYFSV